MTPYYACRWLSSQTPPPPNTHTHTHTQIMIGGNCHKYHFCCDKIALLQQIFVATNTFVTTKVLSHQTYFCCNRRIFCCSKHMFVTTKEILSQQNFCCGKVMFAVTNIGCDKSFVATKNISSILLSWQKTCFVVANTHLSRQNFCRDKNDTCGSSHQWYPPTPLFSLSVSPSTLGLLTYMYKPVTKAHRTFRGGEIHVWLSAFPRGRWVEVSRTLPWHVCDTKTPTFQSVSHLELC